MGQRKISQDVKRGGGGRSEAPGDTCRLPGSLRAPSTTAAGQGTQVSAGGPPPLTGAPAGLSHPGLGTPPDPQIS
ncbi:unnamed protein product [Rangifer tarandus platyrhynchus]|uniref:Uncharacterized protein n=1 Tax=Rangifer tarandus platyrhynchus TaxID=3082113 RepID=A0ABN8YWN3_RANTA|nr:unnamed protein product [Rangifer tarandus platyrhynchus]